MGNENGSVAVEETGPAVDAGGAGGGPALEEGIAAEGGSPESQPGEGGVVTQPNEELEQLKREIAEHRQWRETTEKKWAEEQKTRQPEERRERTAEDWQKIEEGFGFVASKDPETGAETLRIDRRKFLGSLDNMFGVLANNLRQEFQNQLFENVNSFRMDSVFGDLEKRQGTPLADVRQYAEAMRQYLKERYHPKDHANPKFIEDAYYWAKGRGAKDMQKKIENGKEINKKVIHPASGGSTGARPAGSLTEEERKTAKSFGMTDAQFLEYKKKRVA